MRRLPTLPPSARPSYWSFGYVPAGALRVDLVPRLTGARNLFKRLQAPDILRALAIRGSDTVLDLGCGSGYLTLELAKLGRRAIGIDVNEYIAHVRVPRALAGRLYFLRSSGTALAFRNGVFDRVLASEVLPMVPEPSDFLVEVRRVLAPGGRVVVVNGTGPLPLRDAYERNPPFLRRLRERFPGSFPRSYDEYVAAFQRAAGTAQSRFFTEADILRLLEVNGFAIDSVAYSPRAIAGAWFARRQFRHFLRTGNIAWPPTFLGYFLFLSGLCLMGGDGYKGGLIVVATARR